MKEYVLVTDSTADIPVELIEKMNIEIVAFPYIINDVNYRYYPDEREQTIKDFYDILRKGAMPTTSQVNPVLYRETFEEIVKGGKDILYLCFSSGLSGSFQSAKIGADMLTDDYPECRIEVVDTLSASVGEGVFVYQAALLKEQGFSMDQLLDWINEKKDKIRHWFMVEDLFHLKRGGRVSAVEAVVGSALKIKPILSVDEEGKLVVKSKARGSGKAMDYLLNKFLEETEDISNQIAIIGNADDIQKAEKLKQMVIEAGAKEENIFIASIGPIIGTHVGAGMVAIAFFAK